MKNIFASLLFAGSLTSAATLAAAQTPTTQVAAAGIFTGTVADSASRQALPFATVVLRPATDQKNALSTVTDDHGAFRFAGLAAGAYSLEVHYLGYRTSQPVAVVVGAGAPTPPVAVALSPEHHALSEVKVTGTKAFIEQHADKLVLNVAASPIAQGGTAAELLSRAPGVLEQGSGYQLRGKNVTVLLDGKLTNLSGEELKNMLSALPANTLDRVEVVANPSAKYDAKISAVINLVTTKGLKLGTNGTATAGVGAGRYGRYNAGLGLNHRTAKLNVYGGYDRLDNQVYATSRAVRPLSNETQLAENGREIRRNQSNALKLGLDYDLSTTTTVGVLAKGLFTTRTRDGESRAQLEALDGTWQQATLLRTVGAARVSSPSVNVYAKTTFGPDKTLRVSADYFGYYKNYYNEYTTSYFDAHGGATAPVDALRDNSPARNTVKSLTADYAQPFYKGTLEAGLKITATVTDNDIRWEQAPAGQPWNTDLGKTNHFIYRENIHAAYATFSRNLEKVALQVGLRAEQTTTTGTSLTLDHTTERHYLNLFPSVSAQYTKSEKTQVGFAYRRKIDRFQFGIVNPFVTYLSPYRYTQGNPNIRPSFSHNFELSYSYGSLLTAALNYGHHTDVLIDTYRKDNATQVVINSYQNLPSAEQFDATLTLMKPLLGDKWQTVTVLGVMFAQVHAGADAVGLSSASPAAYLSSNHTLTLGHGLRAEVSASYMSPLTFGGVTIQSSFGSSIGLSKAVLKGAGTLTLNVTDPLNTQQQRYQVLAAGLDSHNVNKTESRFVKLNFSYKFGNKNVKAAQRRETGVDSERARME